MNLMQYFMLSYNEGMNNLQHPADLSTLNHFQEGEDRARRAWDELVERQKWKPPYVRDARTKLSHALHILDERLAEIVNPVMRKAHRSTITFENRRAQVRNFTLHECVPLAVRQQGTHRVQYRLLCEIGKEYAPHLRGVSVANMKSILLFVNAILFGRADITPIWFPEIPLDVDSCRADLRHITPVQWLDRYRRICLNGRRISFDLFRKEMRLLQILHAEILHVQRPKCFVGIPIPKANSWRCSDRDAGACGASSASTLNTSAGSSELEVAARERRQTSISISLIQGILHVTLREKVAALRGEFCHLEAEEHDQSGSTLHPAWFSLSGKAHNIHSGRGAQHRPCGDGPFGTGCDYSIYRNGTPARRAKSLAPGRGCTAHTCYPRARCRPHNGKGWKET
jgi:hypothetical protein